VAGDREAVAPPKGKKGTLASALDGGRGKRERERCSLRCQGKKKKNVHFSGAGRKKGEGRGRDSPLAGHKKKREERNTAQLIAVPPASRKMGGRKKNVG